MKKGFALVAKKSGPHTYIHIHIYINIRERKKDFTARRRKRCYLDAQCIYSTLLLWRKVFICAVYISIYIRVCMRDTLFLEFFNRNSRVVILWRERKRAATLVYVFSRIILLPNNHASKRINIQREFFVIYIMYCAMWEIAQHSILLTIRIHYTIIYSRIEYNHSRPIAHSRVQK